MLNDWCGSQITQHNNQAMEEAKVAPQDIQPEELPKASDEPSSSERKTTDGALTEEKNTTEAPVLSGGVPGGGVPAEPAHYEAKKAAGVQGAGDVGIDEEDGMVVQENSGTQNWNPVRNF